jgi:mannose-1-phosphate guanylyltransferase/mannose-6-phosphate isomerase
MSDKNNYAIILCGGSGTRLWPLSRTMRPKQLLALNGDKTLLQQTANRLTKLVTEDHLYTVTHEDHKFEVIGQLVEEHIASVQNVLAEPISKNTLPAIAWATYSIFKSNADAVIGVFPSDHSIDNELVFLKAWQAAEKAANKDYIVLLGIEPSSPATGYGYIKPSKLLDIDSALPIYEVDTFVEKPVTLEAEKFLRDGYLWNSGMFVFKAKTFLSILKTCQPEIYEQITKLSLDNIGETYANLPTLSMDYGLLEKADKVAVVPADMSWSDLGNWNSIYDKHKKDNKNNVSHGSVINLDTTNSLIWSESGLISTLGLDNIVAIQTADATLICDRNRSEDIKLLVSEIKAQKPLLTEIHQIVYRPWGSYTVLEESERFKIKRIVVNPRAKLSMQLHQHRSEHWVVVSGLATITNNGNTYTLEENQSTYIPKTHRHRLSNETDQTLVMIEVQCGDYVGEDDIVRFDDHYGRTSND